LHLALADLPVTFFPNLPASVHRDRETLTCLRSVLMKPEHLDWVDRIWDILASAADTVGGATLKRDPAPSKGRDG
jgi:tyrosine decarboxylase / aspartate 1-decarboxylase